MKRNISLNDLLIEELTDLLNAESQLVEALPKIAQACQSAALKSALEDHLEVTREHLYRLQNIFSDIGQGPQGVICEAMKDIIGEGADVINNAPRGSARDVAIIGVAQRMEKYEIAGYRMTCDHASDLGHTRIVGLLYRTLEEERAMNFYLNELAQNMINIEGSGGFYIAEGKFKKGSVKKKHRSIDVSRFISEGNPNIQEPP